MQIVRDQKVSLIALSVLILLSGCEKRSWTRDEIADIASDAAWQSVEGVEGAARQSDIDDLSARINTLEQENASLKVEINSVADQANRIASQVDNNARVFNNHLNEYALHTHH